MSLPLRPPPISLKPFADLGIRGEEAKVADKKRLDDARRGDLLRALQARFEKNPDRHPALSWAAVQAKLDAAPEKLWSLAEMERTGGEPDVVSALASAAGEIVFVDCSPESPAGRRSLCYDREGLEDRKDARPESSALDVAVTIGIELLSEDLYRALQSVGEFDLKTSSWLLTPAPMRAKGGALFGDRRYGRVFSYHNGASAYYGVRGFRGLVRL